MTLRWKTLLSLFLILVIASFLRLYSLDGTPPGLYSDEAMNGNNAVQALRHPSADGGGLKVFYTENNGREGLFMNIQALSISVFGNNIWALRLPAALFGILTALGIYLLTKELFGRHDIALFAAFLIATSFWHINFSRIAFRAIMAPAFLTWGLYFLLASYKTYKSYWSYLLPLLAGAIYGLGMHSYIAYRATPLLIAFSLWLLAFRYGWKRTLKISAIFAATAIIVFLPLGFYFLENPGDFFGRTSQISVWQSETPLKDLGLNILKTAGMFNIAGDWNPRHNVPGAPLLYWPVGILFLVGLVIGIWSLFRNWKLEIRNFGGNIKFANLILLGWLIVSAIPVIVSNEGMPHALRAILMAPPIFILSSLGGAWLYEKIKPMELLRRVGFAGLIIVVLINAYITYFHDWAKRPDVAEAFNQGYVQIGRELNELPEELPKYVVIDTGGHDVREIGTPAQTIMYVTDTYLAEKQKEKNIYYIEPRQISEIPENSSVFLLF